MKTLLIFLALATAAQAQCQPYSTSQNQLYQQEMIQLQREQNAILERQYRAGNPTANYPVWDSLRERRQGPDPTDAIIQYQLEKTFNRD